MIFCIGGLQETIVLGTSKCNFCINHYSKHFVKVCQVVE